MILVGKYVSEELPLWWVYVVGLHVVGFLYFGYLHRRIFRNRKNGEFMSIVLTVLGPGLGQAYNRQMKKAIVAFILIFTFLVLVQQDVITSENALYVFFGIYFLIAVDAFMGTKKAYERTLRESRMKILRSKAKKIATHQADEQNFAIDTNILMHEPDFLVYLLENHDMDLYMSMMVFNELDGLKKNDNVITRKKAQMAFDVIEEFQRRNKLHLLKTPKTEAIRKFGLSGSPDEKIIGTYLRAIHSDKLNLMFLSNDKGARIIARNVGLPVIEL